METKYLLVGKSDFDFNDRSPERMRLLNIELKKRIEAVYRKIEEK